jgi:SAM-dependent methyltransferase
MTIESSATPASSAPVPDERDDNKPWFHVPVHAATMKKVLDFCRIDPEADNRKLRLLDFGCGAGRYLMGFADYIPLANLHGVDTDPDALAQATKAGLQCRRLDAGQPALDFEDSFFDVVFSSNVIEHIPRPLYLKYLAEIHRVLKPGGTFALGAPNYPFKRFYDVSTALRQHTREERDYYLFDDPTHCNKVFILQVERDLRRYFTDIRLMPSYLLLQKKFAFLRKPEVQHCLRALGYKFFGNCRKPLDSVACHPNGRSFP